MTNDARVRALKQELETFEAPTEKCEQARTGMLELLATSKEPFSREHDIHHFTASAIVMSERGVLLHKHKRSGDWLQPGGHIDGDEWPAEAAVRETLEETGIQAHHPPTGPLLMALDVHHTINGHVHYDLVYLLESEPMDPVAPEGESPDVGWFPKDDAMDITDDVCRGFIVTASTLRLR